METLELKNTKEQSGEQRCDCCTGTVMAMAVFIFLVIGAAWFFATI